MNAALKKIGPMEWVENRSKINPKKNKKQYHALFPNITSYWARHTWATIAASLDIPKETIAAALGHVGNTVRTSTSTSTSGKWMKSIEK